MKRFFVDLYNFADRLFEPINLTAVSFKMIPEESIANSLEKSRPSLNSQPMVFPKSCVTETAAKLP
jgi:hypothetical protein